MILSDEQTQIYDIIKREQNCIVNACAGSGKSTTILSIAKLLPDRHFIQLTYNTMLCKEVRDKVKEMNLKNIQVMTFHSLTVKYYSNIGYTDTEMRRVVAENIEKRHASPDVNVLVIDEAQDMTRLYFKLLIKFCRDIGQKIQLFILGDYMQGLYGFKGSDIRYLTFADLLWQNFELLKTPIFAKCSLTMSYRITNQMANFINQVMIGDESQTKIRACKDNQPVVYIRRFKHQGYSIIIQKIKRILELGEHPADIFILSSSVKNNVMKTLENYLVNHNIPCYVQTNEKIDEKVIGGKVVFSSFHSVKGRQRKYVFIIGFDDTYFTYYGRTLDKNICPNTLYVAATRATHQLILFENQDERPLTFLKKPPQEIKKMPFVDYHGIVQNVYHEKPRQAIENGQPKVKQINITPTELIRFLPEEFYETFPNIDKFFCIVPNTAATTAAEENMLDIPNTILTSSGGYEEVADLNGIAIPNMFFMRNRENILKIYSAEILQQLEYETKSKSAPLQFLKQKIDELPDICVTAADFLRSANVYKTMMDKFYYKLKQIETADYSWLSPEILQDCFKNMENAFQSPSTHATTTATKTTAQKYKRMRAKSIFESCELEKVIINQSNEEQHQAIDEFLQQHADELLTENRKYRITARIDLIFDTADNETAIWEIKCTTSIHIEHLLQVIIYAWIYETTAAKTPATTIYKLFNIKTNEIFELEYEKNKQEIDNIILYILKYKYGTQREVTETDEYFLEHNAALIRQDA